MLLPIALGLDLSVQFTRLLDKKVHFAHSLNEIRESEGLSCEGSRTLVI